MRIKLATFLLLSAGFAQADWQQEFFSPIDNELPKANGLTVDNSGYVHVQSFNRSPDSDNYHLMHAYTINSAGQVPWIWGLQNIQNISDCGVYGRSGQRLDCSLRQSWEGDRTQLTMRARSNSSVLWEVQLPMTHLLLDASIPLEDEAVVVSKSQPFGKSPYLTVHRLSNGQINSSQETPACALPNQELLLSKFRMPSTTGQSIRHLSVCGALSTGSEITLSEWNQISNSWAVLSTRFLPNGVTVEHAAINANGHAFVLTQQWNGFAELHSTHQVNDQWLPLPVFVEGFVRFMFASNEKLVLASHDGSKKAAATVTHATWINLQGAPWFDTRAIDLNLRSIDGVALSSDSSLIFVGPMGYTREQLRTVLQANEMGQVNQVGYLPYQRDERVMNTQVRATVNNEVVVARTLDRYGSVGIQVNQYALSK
jgi:hypothetical protein